MTKKIEVSQSTERPYLIYGNINKKGEIVYGN